MTRERIEDFREIVLPFLSRTLLKTNYENMGKSDAEEFEKDFNEILNLAIKALEQEPCDYKVLYENYLKKSSIVIEQLRADRDRLLEDIDKIRAEIEDLAVLGDARPNISDGYHNAMKDVLEVVHKYCGDNKKQERNTDDSRG